MVLAPTSPPGFPLQRFLKDGAYSMGFNLLVALALTFVSGKTDYFLENLVYSMCIGTIAFAVIDGVRLGLWGHSPRPRWLRFFVLVAIAVPVAQIAGTRLATYLLGFDQSKVPDIGSARSTSLMLFTLMAAGAATLFFTNRERIIRAEAAIAQEKARSEAIARQAMQAQLQLLQAQVEPHMLFNTLANLQGMIAIDPARAQLMLDQLIQYLRATLSSSRAEATTLGQEFALMEAYLGLMSVRMGARLRFELALPAALRGASVPPMLLQPLVENAIIHGLEPHIDGGQVAVSAAVVDGALLLTVADTGLGLGAPSPKAGSALGVANTRERLRALHGERASLTLVPNTPRGAIARLTLPMDVS